MSSTTRDPLDFLRRWHDDERIGIDEVWFVDARPGESSVLIGRRPAAGGGLLRLEAGTDDVLTSPALEGFEVPVSRLFERWGG